MAPDLAPLGYSLLGGRLLAGAATLALLPALFWTDSRGAWLGAAAGLGLVALVWLAPYAVNAWEGASASDILVYRVWRWPALVAGIAALALLLVMATDWYSTTLGDDARQIQKISTPQKGAATGEAEALRRSDAKFLAQSQEKNAWQLDAGIDRVILVLLLGTIILAVAAAWLSRFPGRDAGDTVRPRPCGSCRALWCRSSSAMRSPTTPPC